MLNTFQIAALSIIMAAAQQSFATTENRAKVSCAATTAAAGDEEKRSTQRVDAGAFIERLIERYRSLTTYRDLTSVVQITRDGSRGPGAQPLRTETQMVCDILDGELRIVTPGSQLRTALSETFGLNVRVHPGRVHEADSAEAAQDVAMADCDAAGETRGAAQKEEDRQDSTARADEHTVASVSTELALRYNLWLAPHLALRFSDDPLGEFRPGPRERFTASEAAAVTVEDRVMVHVELKSGIASACPSVPEDFDAKFDLYINPDSMLIERIEGRERLPDGGSIETTFTIKPITASFEDEPCEGACGASGAIETPAGMDAPQPGVCADI